MRINNQTRSELRRDSRNVRKIRKHSGQFQAVRIQLYIKCTAWLDLYPHAETT
jgi:hypothetical protein